MFSSNLSTLLELHPLILNIYALIYLFCLYFNQSFSSIFRMLSILLFGNLNWTTFIVGWPLLCFCVYIIIFHIFIKMRPSTKISNHLFMIFKSFRLFLRCIFWLFAEHKKEFHQKRSEVIN